MNHKTITIKKKCQKKKVKVNQILCDLMPENVLNRLYLNISFLGVKEAKINIIKKMNSYQMQDKKKLKFDMVRFITYDQLLEKMIVSRMRCYYCCSRMKLFYQISRDPLQWTLDRLDNTEGHNEGNVVVSCLKCNLERRTQNDEKFLFSKRMKIIKK